MKNETNVYQKKAEDISCREKWAQQLTSMLIFFPTSASLTFFLPASFSMQEELLCIAEKTSVNERIINTKMLMTYDDYKDELCLRPAANRIPEKHP